MLKNDINIPLLVTITAVSALLLIVVLVGVHAFYLYEVDLETQAKWGPGKVTYSQVHDLKAAQTAALNAPPKWVDRDKGIVAIPIDQAMELIVKNGGKLPKAQ